MTKYMSLLSTSAIILLSQTYLIKLGGPNLNYSLKNDYKLIILKVLISDWGMFFKKITK